MEFVHKPTIKPRVSKTGIFDKVFKLFSKKPRKQGTKFLKKQDESALTQMLPVIAVAGGGYLLGKLCFNASCIDHELLDLKEDSFERNEKIHFFFKITKIP